MIMNTYFKFVNIKYVDKNDKKSTCKDTKKELAVGDPVWVCTKASKPMGRSKPVSASNKLVLHRPKKYSNAAAFQKFFERPHELYRFLRQKKETNKSLKTIIQEQIQTWIDQGATHIDQFQKQTNDFVFDKIKGYVIGYFKAFRDLNLALQKSPSAGIKFNFNPKSDDYLAKKLILTMDFDFQLLENKFHGLKELMFVVNYFKEKFDFAQYLTHTDYLDREIAKSLTAIDFSKESEKVADALIQHIYTTCNAKILTWHHPTMTVVGLADPTTLTTASYSSIGQPLVPSTGHSSVTMKKANQKYAGISQNISSSKLRKTRNLDSWGL